MENTSKEREHLIRRKNEIEVELADVNDDLRMELDPDGEEQAIQIEQDEVAVSMESNLRRELSEIEEKLREIGD